MKVNKSVYTPQLLHQIATSLFDSSTHSAFPKPTGHVLSGFIVKKEEAPNKLGASLFLIDYNWIV